jgi:hypothetical protein
MYNMEKYEAMMGWADGWAGETMNMYRIFVWQWFGKWIIWKAEEKMGE